MSVEHGDFEGYVREQLSDIQEEIADLTDAIRNQNGRVTELEQWRQQHSGRSQEFRKEMRERLSNIENHMEVFAAVALDVKRAKKILYGIGVLLGIVGTGALNELGKWLFHGFGG